MIKRAEQRKEDTWAIEDLFPDDRAAEEAIGALPAYRERLQTFRGRLGESGETLLSYFHLCDELGQAVDRVANYALRRHDEDTANAYYQGMRGKVLGLCAAIGEAGAFAEPELLGLPDELIDRYLADTPGLAVYRRPIERLRARRAHILPEAQEALLASAAEPLQAADGIASVLRDADLRFSSARDAAGQRYPVSQANVIELMRSPDRTLRRSAFRSLYRGFGSVRNTLAACLDGEVKRALFLTRARGYESSLARALDGTEVPAAVYTGLIDTVRHHLAPLHRYMDVRRRIMGLPRLHMYDIYVPLVPSADRRIPYEEAQQTVLAALAPLGEEYLALLRRGFAERWIDVYPNEGKRSGAYSSAGTPHPYVLLNYSDTLDQVFTLAHEMGHALHSCRSIAGQPACTADYVIFVAEVASTCNEALLMQYLLARTTDRAERAYLINYFLEQFRTTLYRQTMFAEFELEMHRMSAAGETLTADALSRAYGALNRAYYGDGVVLDPGIEDEWARIPHFFYDFYVYQYATGFSAAIALSRRILSGDPTAVSRYLAFLAGGSSKPPVELLRDAGVDMTTPEPIEEAIAFFDELITEFEILMKYEESAK